jgi:hypothetical protein
VVDHQTWIEPGKGASMALRYEYKFVRLGEYGGSALFGVSDKARNAYEDAVHQHARDGWRLVQIFAPGVAAFGAAKYYELIFERERAEDATAPSAPGGGVSPVRNDVRLLNAGCDRSCRCASRLLVPWVPNVHRRLPVLFLQVHPICPRWVAAEPRGAAGPNGLDDWDCRLSKSGEPASCWGCWAAPAWLRPAKPLRSARCGSSVNRQEARWAPCGGISDSKDWGC